MRIKLSTPQDLDDESAHTISPPDADTAGKPSSENDNPTPSNATGLYAIVGLALFAIATMVFMLMGGLRWLHRLIATRHRGRYLKVDDEDPEK